MLIFSGIIYCLQGRTMEDSHSLHITLSVGQKNTWGDLLRKVRCSNNVFIAVDV